MIVGALIKMLQPYQPWVQTITVDNGLEFAAHTLAAEHLQAQFYFCKPYHSWQRGSIEQLNRLVKEYLNEPVLTTVQDVLLKMQFEHQTCISHWNLGNLASSLSVTYRVLVA